MRVVTGTVPYLSSTGANFDCGMVDTATLSLPHVWWNIHADGAPTLLLDLAAQVFSSVSTSASGERSFKRRSRVHTRIRKRLSDVKADMTQAILFQYTPEETVCRRGSVTPPLFSGGEADPVRHL
jgi:hypothetical protein